MESPQVPEVNETAGDLPSGPGEVVGSSRRLKNPDVYPRFASGMSCDPSFSLVRPTLMLLGPLERGCREADKVL